MPFDPLSAVLPILALNVLLQGSGNGSGTQLGWSDGRPDVLAFQKEPELRTIVGSALRCPAKPKPGSPMYTKPTLEKFGTFRELTMLGFLGASDGQFIWGDASGNNCYIEGYWLHCQLPSSS